MTTKSKEAAGGGTGPRRSLLLELALAHTAGEFAAALQILFAELRDHTYALFVDAGWCEGDTYCRNESYARETAHRGFVAHPHNRLSHAGTRYAEVRKITPLGIEEAHALASELLAARGFKTGAAGAVSAAG